tara:strand:+ start:455 stop:1900 length:1446 start_codon:yes stop_codon:yes gene_type:complete
MTVQKKICPIILSGGSGTRLWPISRSTMPKQFSNLFEDTSLFEKTINRLTGSIFLDPIVVSGEVSRFMVKNIMNKTGFNNPQIIIEPSPKDTAPAALTGIIHANKLSKDPIVLISPSDHWIKDETYFQNLIKNSIDYISENNIIIFGIKPRHPHTGYGWITTKDDSFKKDKSFFEVVNFIEKPPLITAQKLFNNRFNFWNSGIFLGKASSFINAYKKYCNEIFEKANLSYENSLIDLGFVRLERNYWYQLTKNSIDYAIIEKLEKINMVPFEKEWSDVGSLQSLMQHFPKDEKQNVTLGSSTLIDSENTFLNSINNETHLVGMGLKNIIAVATKDAVLCIDQSKSENVKNVVEKLIEKNIEQAEKSLTDFRPWGSFEILSKGKNFQVKKIKVHPNCKLSLQSHKHRSEHWVVVEGKALVTLDTNTITISQNESIFINSGVKHRLENPTNQNLIIIEIQTGTYLGEDDIIRYEDDYKRLSDD